MKITNTEWGIFGIIGFLVLLVVSIFIGPFVFFWLSYFGGWIAKVTIGKYLVAGFELLGITLPLNKIPLIAGLLGWIGSFFKNFNTTTKN